MPSTSWFLLLLAISAATATNTTIYEALTYYGFPPGLVPKDVVTSFDLNPNTGHFTLTLNHTCSFPAYHYEVDFQTQISGFIIFEEIKNLHGVEVKIVDYFWARLVTVEMNDDEIEFTAGKQSTAEFPVFDFYRIPECGCGFNCGQAVA